MGQKRLKEIIPEVGGSLSGEDELALLALATVEARRRAPDDARVAGMYGDLGRIRPEVGHLATAEAVERSVGPVEPA